MSESTGEVSLVELDHEKPEEMREFYRGMREERSVIGLEASGSSQWFERMVEGLGYEVWHGNAAEIRRMAPRRQKNDARDAALILELLVRGEFPRVYRPKPESLDVLSSLRLRHQLVKMRTMVMNGLHATAFNAGVVKKQRMGPKACANLRAQEMGSEALNRKRDTLVKVQGFLEGQIADLEGQLASMAAGDADVALLQTHPGIGLLSSLAVAHTLRPVERFQRGRQVVAFAGMDPMERSSGEKKGYEGISKAGSKLLRFLIGEAGRTAARVEEGDLGRKYKNLSYRRGKAKATVAVARRLLVRCWIMLRDGIDYAEFRRRGQAMKENRDHRTSTVS